MTTSAASAENGLHDPRFAVHRRIEVLALLRQLADTQAPVVLGHGGSLPHGPAETVCARLRGVHPERDELLFDADGDDAQWQRLVAAPALTVEGQLQSVRLLFEAGPARADAAHGSHAFLVAMPSSIQRLQRREAYRVPAPADPVLECRCNPRHDLDRVARLRVQDLSAGGASLALDDPTLVLAPGDLLGNCRIELPGVGTLFCSLQIRNLDHFTARDAERGHWRLGCVFIDLPGPSVTQLQRYLNNLQRERRAQA